LLGKILVPFIGLFAAASLSPNSPPKHRRNEYEIDAMPVLAITSQFLAYVKAAREIDAELGGELVEVASWLVLLKLRSLLPVRDAEEPSPCEELRRVVLNC
jgi:chromatin segregation and condensation protein Rec8/ScpA/Scc1 (kleisin family)